MEYLNSQDNKDPKSEKDSKTDAPVLQENAGNFFKEEGVKNFEDQRNNNTVEKKQKAGETIGLFTYKHNEQMG